MRRGGEAQGQRSRERRVAMRCGAVHACPSSRSQRFERHEQCVPLCSVLLKSWSRVNGRADGGLTTDGAGRRWESDGAGWPSRCQSVESDMQVSTLAHEGRLFFFFFCFFFLLGGVVRRGAGLKRAAAPAWSGCMIFWVALDPIMGTKAPTSMLELAPGNRAISEAPTHALGCGRRR